MSKIEWTEKTWNPTLGCTEVSPGCTNCYAARMAWRLMHNPTMAKDYEGLTKISASGKVVWTGEIRMLPERLLEPVNWKKPTIIFVDSMSDLFHLDVPFSFIDQVFDIMRSCPQHIFQILTKRPERMLEYMNHTKIPPLPNVWLGTSIENQKAMEERIEFLIQIDAAVRFLSCEPLLGPVWLPIDANDGSSFIDWVICGGESGPNARPMHPDWVRSLKDQCKAAGVAFFFKQWGEYAPHHAEAKKRISMVCNGIGYEMCKVGKKKAGRLLDGHEYNELPGGDGLPF